MRTLDVGTVEVPDDHRHLAWWALKTCNINYKELAKAYDYSDVHFFKTLVGEHKASSNVKAIVVEALGGRFTAEELFDR